MFLRSVSLRPLFSSAVAGRNLRLLAVFITSVVAFICPRGNPADSAGPYSPAPAASPAPVVSLNVPGETMIGEDFKFEIQFDNSAGPAGYAPYVELYLPAKGADSNSLNQKCDGISLQSANTPVALFASPPSITLSPSYVSTLSSNPSNLNCANPYVLPFNGMTALSSAPNGDYQLVVIELPFGSFDASQPAVTVKVTAHLSDFADLNTPLTIFARGGFRYGSDPLDNPGGDPLIESAVTSAQITPAVLKIGKAYIGPEEETATGPNFPRKYVITADIADGQPMRDLVINDNLPNNLKYIGNLQTVIKGSAANVVTSCPSAPGVLDVAVVSPAAGPGGLLSVKFCSPVTGSAAPDDVTITFGVFVPDLDANTQLVLRKDCSNAPVAVENDINAVGNWDPLDPRDAAAGVTIPVDTDVAKIDNVFQAKCLTIQKSSVTIVQNVGGSGFTPGDTLEYELQFQISDYFTIGKLVVRDYLGDGQDYITGPTSRLTVTDQFGSKSGAFPSVLVQKDESGGENFCSPSRPPKAGLVLTFDVSGAMGVIAPLSTMPRLDNGILTGGLAASTTLAAPATGTIRFRTTIRDEFRFLSSTFPGDKYVDKHDPINNCVRIDAAVYNNVNRPKPINAPLNIPTAVIGNANDTSKLDVTIAADTLEKSIYAVKRGATFICGPATTPCVLPPAAPEVQPGDQVSFRIHKTLQSGDGEDVSIRDWLPLPIFNIGSGMNFTNAACGANLAPATACLGPNDTVHSLVSASVPSFAIDSATNSVSFTYGDINDPANQLNQIDLIFTATVTNVPFADGLFLTNDVQECEGNTFSTAANICQRSIAQVKLREPRLSIRKGVVATDNPHGEFKPALNPAGVWKPFGASCPAFNPKITSGTLPGLLNSDLVNVDAGDPVTFAIAIENTGGAPAYNIEFAEIMPLDALDKPSCFSPDGGFCVTTGDGIPIPFSIIGGGFGQTVIRLNNPLAPLNSTTSLDGTNVAIITFNAKLLDKDQLKAGCCGNRTRLRRYTSTPKAQLSTNTNFVDAGIGGPVDPGDNDGPFEDKASVCIGPKALAKCITRTSEKHTVPQDSSSGAVPLAIGEIARMRLVASVPEGLSPAFQVEDLLPPGLAYVGNPKVGFVSSTIGNVTSTTLSGTGLNFAGNDTSVTCVPPSPLLTVAIPSVTTAPGTVKFNLGDLHNSDNDLDLELVVIEFNVVVENVASNQAGTVLTNRFDFIVDGQAFDTGNPISVSVGVVEPQITVTKTVAPNPAQKGQTLTYTVQYQNTGSTDAFEVALTDTLPSGLSPGAITSTCPATVSGNVITMNCAQVPASPQPGSTVILTYQTLANPPDCPTVLSNQVQLVWTSLPGTGTPLSPDNLTGSVTPGASGAINGERNGVTSSNSANDYAASASATTTVDCGCCANPPSDMVSWWPLDDLPGATSVIDIVDGNYGAPRNSSGALAPIGSVGAPNSLAAQVGSGLGFVNSYTDVANGPSLNFAAGEFSIDAWVRVIPVATTGAAIQAIVDKSLPAGSATSGYALFVFHPMGSTTGQLAFVLGDGSTAITPLYHPAPLSSAWYHVAVTVGRPSAASATITLYVNGVASTSTMSVGSTSNSSNLWVGKSRLYGALHANIREVMLDEIEIFKRSLTSAEVQTVFKAGPTGKCKAQLSGVKFHDLNGNGVRDSGEPGLANWTIQVKDQNGNVHTVTTDSGGNYSLMVPAPGSYTVSEVLQSGWIQTAPTAGSYNVTVVGNQALTLNFGNRKKTAQICDLMVAKEVKPTPLISGQPATVIVTVTNVGSGPCPGPTKVSESITTSLVSAGGPGWNCSGINCTYAGVINAGASVSVTYVYNVTAAGGSIITNCVEVKNPKDGNTSNNKHCIDVKVEARPPDLMIKKEVHCGPTPVPTMICDTTFTITNDPSAGSFNGFLDLHDVVSPAPGLMSLTGSSPPGWNVSIGPPDTINCSSMGPITLSPGASTSFTVKVVMTRGTFTDCVNVKGYAQPPFTAGSLIGEANLNNNQACAQMSLPSLAGADDLSFHWKSRLLTEFCKLGQSESLTYLVILRRSRAICES